MSEWHQFSEVTRYVCAGQRLFRSSAPNYDGTDSTQRLTQSAVDFLVNQGINGIISFNSLRYTEQELGRLNEAGITYLHLPVVDFTAPTIQQLQAAIKFYQANTQGGTLVHCGYGHGRTGTGVTALQLFATRGENPSESSWKTDNHVEEENQVEVLRELRKQPWISQKGGSSRLPRDEL